MSFKELTIDQLLKELDRHSFKQLHIHHTWRPNHSNFTGNNHQRMQQGMKNYHVDTNGWRDIGQNLTLFPDGIWLEGRKIGNTPASIKGWNTGALAVEMIGNFDTGNDVLKGNQLNQILLLVKYFIDRYGERSIKFHREGPGAGKTCPGTSLNKQTMINQAKMIGDEKVSEDRIREIIQEEISKVMRPSATTPGLGKWANPHYVNLNARGIEVDEKRFNDVITRGDVFALLGRLTEPNTFYGLISHSKEHKDKGD